MNWDDYPNFSKAEFDCKQTGENEMRSEFMDVLQRIRTLYNRPIRITSGYRSPDHSIERAKGSPGAHAYGLACDIATRGTDMQLLMVLAYNEGIRRFGLDQKGSSRFMHIDIADKNLHFPRSTWTY